MLSEDILKHHFDICFPDKRNSNYIKYIEILKNKAILPKTDNNSSKKKQNEEDNLNIKEGYRKWKIIPRMYFKTNGIDQDISNNRENIVFLRPVYYFLSSYLLMFYFYDIGNEILGAFFYGRLKDILKRKNTDKNIENRVEYLKLKNNRKALLYKIRNRKSIEKEDYETIRNIFSRP